MSDPRQPMVDALLAALPPGAPARAAVARALAVLDENGFLVAGLTTGARPALRLLGDDDTLELTADQLVALAAAVDRGEARPWERLLLHDPSPTGAPRPRGRRR